VILKKKKKQSLAALKKKVQKTCNEYIRKRDSSNGYFVCISCQKTLPMDKCNAGHYVPVGKSQFLRFNELNINAQCVGCNLFDNFHLIPYRKNLINKIGLEAVESLERTAEEVKVYKWTRDKLIEVENYYKSLTNGKE
jgi:hypothetical protein